MLVVALVLAVVALAALVTAVVASNELVAWVCVGASALGVVLLIVDSIRERKKRRIEALVADADQSETTAVIAAVVPFDESPTEVVVGLTGIEPDTELGPEADLGEVELEDVEEYLPEDSSRDSSEEGAVEETVVAREVAEEDHPEELVHDEPDFDTGSDDEPEFPEAAEEAAVHPIDPDAPDLEDPHAEDPDTENPDAADSGKPPAAVD